QAPGEAPVEISSSTNFWTGQINLSISASLENGKSWNINAAVVGQPLSPEITLETAEITGLNHFAFCAHYRSATRTDRYFLRNLEIRLYESDTPETAVARTLADRYPDKNRFLFTSTQAVAQQETPRKGLALKQGAATLIEGLANPAPHENGTKFIHI
ncbi:MAG: hypothetical protein AAF570_23110, partial [Bacteroidota bacterium]